MNLGSNTPLKRSKELDFSNLCHKFSLVRIVIYEKYVKLVSQKWQGNCQKGVFFAIL